MATAKTVKDVPPHEFVKHYTFHFKRSGKVKKALFRDGERIMATAKTVKDVSPHEFVKHYAFHLKRFGKVKKALVCDGERSMATAKTVKLVSPDEFVKLYAAHLKRLKKALVCDGETAKTVKDVSPHEFVKRYAAHLKRSRKIELPEWTDIVKTATFKEFVPYDPDWYYIRAASMARKIYLRGGLGVGAFKRIYGGSKRNGSRPPHFCESSGAIARHILQQLAKVKIIEIDPKGGRRITSNGRRDLDQVAGWIVVAP